MLNDSCWLIATRIIIVFQVCHCYSEVHEVLKLEFHRIFHEIIIVILIVIHLTNYTIVWAAGAHWIYLETLMFNFVALSIIFLLISRFNYIDRAVVLAVPTAKFLFLRILSLKSTNFVLAIRRIWQHFSEFVFAILWRNILISSFNGVI